jgi:hypothetical protein
MGADIHDQWTWKEGDTAKTLARYKLDTLFEKYGIGANAEDLFDEVPATYVHKGDIAVKKPLLLDAKGHGIFIIDGSLTIDGAFTYYTADAYTILVITGDFHAAHYYQAQDTQLVVLGETTIDGLLYINVSDAGFAVFRGPVTSRDRLIHQDVLSDVPMFAKRPTGKERDGLAADESTHPPDLHAKLVKNVDLFPPPPKGTKKPPKDAELKKMTVEEVLTVTGFEEMMIQDAAINPNWFRLGKPGEPLKKLQLIAETYIAEFPTALATLESLTLLNNADGAKLATLLRSLPVLRGLKKLRFSGTAIDRIPAEIGMLENLEELEIYGNKKLTALPSEIGKLARLRSLTVTDNAIKKLPAGLDLDRIPTLNFDEKALKERRDPE